ncbi:unnamed protein product [Allacma fusca]|uniref:Uncharacterized protein n=1 Tax=Allacma fusca TaxID=39272 RepID=A0A8J2L194_9HEXA|nr:unnamed protein product [Allacma fusca]
MGNTERSKGVKYFGNVIVKGQSSKQLLLHNVLSVCWKASVIYFPLGLPYNWFDFFYHFKVERIYASKMINDMLDELDVVKAAEIADRVLPHSKVALAGGVFFFILFLLLVAILVLLVVKLGKGQRVACSCGGSGSTPQKFA